MNHIKIDAAMSAIINSKVVFGGGSKNTQSEQPIENKSQGLEHMNKLLNILKTAPETATADVRVMELKQKVFAAEYQLDIDSLVENLFYDLTLNGAS